MQVIALSKATRHVAAAFGKAELRWITPFFDLETHGFGRAALSVLATEEAVTRELGHHYRQERELEDDPLVPPETFFTKMSEIEAAYLPAPGFVTFGGLTMVGVGSAAVPAVDSSREWELIDAVIGGMIRRHDTTRVQEQRARGGIVLWFNVRDAAEKELAMQIRQEPGAYDVMCTEPALQEHLSSSTEV